MMRNTFKFCLFAYSLSLEKGLIKLEQGDRGCNLECVAPKETKEFFKFCIVILHCLNGVYPSVWFFAKKNYNRQPNRIAIIETDRVQVKTETKFKIRFGSVIGFLSLDRKPR